MTLQEAKVWCKVDLEEDNALITMLIRAARQWFEAACDRSFTVRTWLLALPYFPWRGIELPYPPSEVVAIEYLDTGGNLQTLDPAVYVLNVGVLPARIQLVFTQAWPATTQDPAAVQITFRSTGENDDRLEMARAGILMLVAFWYIHRGDDQQDARTPDATAMMQPGRIPPQVQALAITAGSYRF